MVKFLFIRHGRTQSNLERRYSGDVNEPLCPRGVRETAALTGKLPRVDTVISGAAVRCRQTAELLFTETGYTLCGLVETDFGVFAGKNADEMIDDEAYSRWVDTGCLGDIPGGDSVVEFKERCCTEFLRIAGSCADGTTAALVIHGGNIMAILERFALPHRDFYDYHAPNCGWYLCRFENGALYIEEQNV